MNEISWSKCFSPDSDCHNQKFSSLSSFSSFPKMWRPRTSIAHNRSIEMFNSKIDRPKTASIISLGTSNRSSNENKYNLRDDQPHRQRFESHLRPKKNKPTPWQKSLEGPMVPLVVTPGYILSKSKSKYDALIKTEEFFNPVHEETVKKKSESIERDELIEQLQQQIADLTLYLQEERYTHRQSKQKAEDFLRDKIEELQNQHKNEIREIEEEHSNNIKKLEASHKEEFEDYKRVMEGQIGEQLSKEKDLEMNAIVKEHKKELQNLKKDHRKELEDMALYYAEVSEKLKEMNALTREHKDLKADHQDLKTAYSELEKHCANVNKELINTRGRLQAHEENFERKVDEVDERYKQKVNNLLMQNAELRKSFRKKCEELAIERYEADEAHQVSIGKLKDKMEDWISRKKESQAASAAVATTAETVNVPQQSWTTGTTSTTDEDT